MDLRTNQTNKLAFVFCALVIGLLACRADAAITGVAGPASTAGTLPQIIPAPSDVLNNFVSNTGQQGFNEAKVVTTLPYTCGGNPFVTDDDVVIPAGTLVSSHMIFLNAPNGFPPPPADPSTGITHEDVIWTFSQAILGVMSDNDGNLEAASSAELGAPGTNYTVGPAAQVAPFPARGMEHHLNPTLPDHYVVSDNQITVTMHVTQPGDWIRVVTCAQGSQGFWKNYEGNWPLNPIEIGGVPYSQEDAITIMEAPVKGDKTLTMFDQLVAAKLNAATSGCFCVNISEYIENADAWMAENPPLSGVEASSDAWKYAEPLYYTLNTYNNEEILCPATPLPPAPPN